jgi:signal transduction histidine kinase
MSQTSIPTNAVNTTLSPWRDLAAVIAITITAALLAAHFQLNEAVFAATRRWEALQLDEGLFAVFVFSLCLMTLSWRRYRQALAQLQARRAAEEQLAEALAANRRLAHEHVRIQECERKHLARELHDELGQYLNAIKLDAVAFSEPDECDSTASLHAATRIVNAVDHVHRTVSDLIRRLRPAGLDELGLVAALESCVDHWRQRLPTTRFLLSTEDDFEDVGEATNLTIYRLIQESLTNASKHADAQLIRVTLLRDGSDPDEIILRVTDDGRGMNTERSTSGFGLIGMRERVAMMGGRFTLTSSLGEGLSVEARLPAQDTDSQLSTHNSQLSPT